MSKKIKEDADINYQVSKDELADVTPELDKVANDGDTVQVTENTGSSDPIKEAFIAGLIEGNSSIEGTFVVVDGRLKNSDIAEKLWQNHISDGVQEDNDLPEIPDADKMERGAEAGITVREDFDKIMEDLKETNAPTIKLKENVRPRIKKSDLIKYIKTKK